MKQTFEECFAADTTPKTITGLDNFGMPDIITKYAGIQITNPTQDNVEDFIRQYAENEISGINNIKLQKMEILPENFDGQNLVSATGSVILQVVGANGKIVLPFSVEDSELNPFDVIQVGDERVPFTRPNLNKIVIGIIKQEKDPMFGSPQGIKKFTPYLGVSKDVMTPASSEGFLGTTLHIQDKYSTRNNGASNATNHWVTAEEILTLTEKVAHLKEREILPEKTAGDIPMEEIDSEFEKKLDKIASIKWEDISSCKTGDYITVPAIVSEPGLTDEFTTVQALVVDTEEGKAVITADCKMALLEHGDKMACVKNGKQMFKLPTVRLSAIEQNDTFLAFKGNDILGPFIRNNWDVVRFVSDRECEGTFGDDLVRETRQYPKNPAEELRYIECEPASKRFKQAETFNRDHVFFVTLPNHKFIKMSADEYRKAAAQEYGISEVTVDNALPYELSSRYVRPYSEGNKRREEGENTIYATDKDTPVVAIKGKFTGFIKTPEEINYFGWEKSAAESGKCEIYRRGENFNVKISYSDKSHKMLSKRTKEFQNIEDYRVKGVLKSLGFEPQEAGEIIWKVKNTGQAIVALPDEDKAKDITGANEMSKIKSDIKGAFDRIGGKNIAKDLGAQFTYALADTMMDPNTPDILTLASAEEKLIEKTAEYLTKRAEVAREIAGEFEKTAVERKSESMKEIASTMVLASELFKKAADMKDYAGMEKVADSIFDMKDFLEKNAYDLTNLAFQERRNGNFIVHPAFCKEAVLLMDEMMKVAEVERCQQ